MLNTTRTNHDNSEEQSSNGAITDTINEASHTSSIYTNLEQESNSTTVSPLRSDGLYQLFSIELDDDDDEEYQDVNEEEDVENLENFDWIDWNDFMEDATSKQDEENEDEFDDDSLVGSSNSVGLKRGRKKYQKFEKPSVLPSIRPKSPPRVAASSSSSTTSNGNANTSSVVNNIQLPPSQPFQYLNPLIPSVLGPPLYPANTAISNKNGTTTSTFPYPFIIPYPDIYRGTMKSTVPPTTSTSTAPRRLPTSDSSLPPNNTISAASSHSDIDGVVVLSNIVTPNCLFSNEQMKELQNQLQLHVQLLLYNYFLTSTREGFHAQHVGFKRLIEQYLATKKEAIMNKTKRILYGFGISKDVKLTDLTNGQEYDLKDDYKKKESITIVQRSTEEWAHMIGTTIFDIEGLDGAETFLNFDYSFVMSSNQIDWDLFVKFLRPFKLFNNQSLLAEVQESIYYLNTVPEDNIGSKRVVFTIPEDNLLIMGLKKHWKPGGTIKWDKIKNDMFPNKTSKQLRVRYKNMIGKRGPPIEVNPFKQFRNIIESQNSTRKHDPLSKKKKDVPSLNYSHLFDNVELFKITNKLTKKELPCSYKELSKIQTYRDNPSSDSEDSESKEVVAPSESRKRKKPEKSSSKKKKKSEVSETDIKESTPAQSQPQKQDTEILEHEKSSSTNGLTDSLMQLIEKQPAENSSIPQPLEDVGSIDSASEDENDDELPQPPPAILRAEKECEVLCDGQFVNFTQEEDRQILVTLKQHGFSDIANITDLTLVKAAIQEVSNSISKSFNSVQARILKLQHFWKQQVSHNVCFDTSQSLKKNNENHPTPNHRGVVAHRSTITGLSLHYSHAEWAYLQEEPCLLKAARLKPLNNGNLQTSSSSMFVHVKLFNHVVMTSDVLEQLARLFKKEDYRVDFQFRSGDSVESHKMFTTRVSQELLSNSLAKNEFIQKTVEWIKRVPSDERVTFSSLSLDSLKFATLQVKFEEEINDLKSTLLPSIQTSFHTQLNSRMMQHLNSISFSNAIQALTNAHARNQNPIVTSRVFNEFMTELNLKKNAENPQDLSTLEFNNVHVEEMRNFFHNQLSNYFDLDWKFDETTPNLLQVSLANFDLNIWYLIQTGKFQEQANTPLVQHFKKREDVEQLFMTQASEVTPEITYLNEMFKDISEQMGQQLLDSFKALESVDLITRGVNYQITNYGANQVVQSGGTDNSYIWNKGISGTGEIVAVTDTGVNVNHCFFSGNGESYSQLNLNNRKIVYIDTQNGAGNTVDDGGHGSHVCGTVAAKDAKLYVVDAQRTASGGLYISDLNVLLPRIYSSGARISSNSWGCASPYECTYDCQCYSVSSSGTKTPVSDSTCLAQVGRRCCHYCNVYGTQSRSIDSVLNRYDELLYVNAAGNSGDYSYDSTMGDPATSKNALTVGSSYASTEYYKMIYPTSNINGSVLNVENLSYFSSRGPTIDQRIKPDVVAPGSYTSSADFRSTCGLAVMSGTSMATPAVSGAAALIRQYLLQNNKQKLVEFELFNKTSTQTLSGSLVKALLIHSAEKLNGMVQLYPNYYQSLAIMPIPNNFVGYGRVNLKRVLKFDNDQTSLSLVGQIGVINRVLLEPGLSSQFELVMGSSNKNTLKVTIVWYDLPYTTALAKGSTEKRIVNDLDLKVTVDGGKSVYYGNGELSKNTNYDSTNTVESITIDNLPSGASCVVSVGAKSSNKGSQAFSLVVSGNFVVKSSPQTRVNATISRNSFEILWTMYILISAALLINMLM
ncbi:hypothetical protein C9374_006137 [Naegleria lovaniensis]|uniref:Myb-like domain-containing protein n=1 Tax=Naegleria lovaniensis TaxID=51637 RepID=A0AA88KJE6_NAELO|nr:uncharacterized protein C9374_006137 [Naegleria lovaniensis]KAG2381753.1 hypothetical protein C9374_006137 [Naegleria lovaniensis]